MLLFEHADGFFCGGFMTVDGHGGIDDLLHLLADAACIVEGDRMADVEIDIIAVGDGDVDSHLAFLVKSVYRLAEHEEKGTGVSTGATG